MTGPLPDLRHGLAAVEHSSLTAMAIHRSPFRPAALLPGACLLAGGALAACGGERPALAGAPSGGPASASPPADAPVAVDLTGAGATFPYPIYARWIGDYLQRTGVRINYQSIGSGGGIRQLAEGTVDFGATDVPMSAAELRGARRAGRQGAPDAGVLHVPMLVGAVAVTYNLPGVDRPLRLAPDVIADLFLGRVTRWNDPRLAALNPGVRLPAADVLVVHRADGSGTTYILTDYLAAVSPAWRAGPGRGKDVRWPVGLGGRGNEGVAGQVKTTPGAIGYVETTYARQNALPVAALRNRAGAFVAPTIATAAAAAAAVLGTRADGTDFRVSLVDAPGADSYPIASLTWLLLDTAPRDTARARQVVDFARWALREGAPAARALGYAPLPADVAHAVDARLDALALTARRAP